MLWNHYSCSYQDQNIMCFISLMILMPWIVCKSFLVHSYESNKFIMTLCVRIRLSLQSMPLIRDNLKNHKYGDDQWNEIFKFFILIKKDLQVAAIQKFTKVSIQDKIKTIHQIQTSSLFHELRLKICKQSFLLKFYIKVWKDHVMMKRYITIRCK